MAERDWRGWAAHDGAAVEPSTGPALRIIALEGNPAFVDVHHRMRSLLSSVLKPVCHVDSRR